MIQRLHLELACKGYNSKYTDTYFIRHGVCDILYVDESITEESDIPAFDSEIETTILIECSLAPRYFEKP